MTASVGTFIHAFLLFVICEATEDTYQYHRQETQETLANITSVAHLYTVKEAALLVAYNDTPDAVCCLEELMDQEWYGSIVDINEDILAAATQMIQLTDALWYNATLECGDDEECLLQVDEDGKNRLDIVEIRQTNTLDEIAAYYLQDIRDFLDTCIDAQT